MKTLKVENVVSGYGKRQIVKGLSFELHEGELCALLGVNGCGKSTLIKTLCALIPAKDGNCSLSGKDLWKLDEKGRAREVAYIPQRSSNIYGRTVTDVVLMGFNAQLGIFDNYSAKHRKAVIEILEKLGIDEFADRLYEELSEGQKQLVILARTIIQNTSVVLMDEPDSALDFTNKSLILEKVRSIIRTEGKIGLVALHDPNAALHFCDRILIMKDGRIIHNIQRSDFVDFPALERSLSDIYPNIRILDNNGIPVMVSSLNS